MEGKSRLPQSGSVPVAGPPAAPAETAPPPTVTPPEGMPGGTPPIVPPPGGPVFAPPPVPPMPQGPVRHLVYDGRLGELYRIFLVNLLLSVVTLTVYRFWGKTRIRRYLWSHTAFDGDRFQYTGTGGELFRGFLVVAAVFAAVALVLGGADLAMALVYPEDLMAAQLATMGLHYLVYVVAFYLLLAGQYMALRYRLTRTRWRAIRGGLDGSPWKYAVAAFAWMLAIGASLGFARPVADVSLARWRLRNVFFGTAQAKLAPDPGTGGLYGPYVASWFATVVGILAFYGAFFGIFVLNLDLLAQYRVDPGDPLPDFERMFEDPGVQRFFLQLVLALLLAAVSAFIFVLIARCWYLTALLRHLGKMVELAGLRVRPTFGTLQLWRLVTGNLLISLFTLGLGQPIVLHRTLRFVAERVELVGAMDGATIGQSPLAVPSRGEGLLEALDAGAGF